MLIEPDITAPSTEPSTHQERAAPTEPLTRDDPMIVLGFRCMQRQYAELVAHGPRPALETSVEDVHRMRIALRRLRVALRLFGHMLPSHDAETLAHELRWLARRLGTVRDLDVHAHELRAHLEHASAEHARELGTYELDLRRQRTAARKELRDVLASERYRAFMATLERTVGRGPSPAASRRFKTFRIRDGARACLRRSRKRVVKLGRKLDARTNADALHRLRIRAKRFRYELEFFAEPYPALRSIVAAIKTLQDALGEERDAALGAIRLAEYRRQQRGRRRDGALPVAALDAWTARTDEAGHAARNALPALWRRVEAALDKKAFASL